MPRRSWKDAHQAEFMAHHETKCELERTREKLKAALAIEAQPAAQEWRPEADSEKIREALTLANNCVLGAVDVDRSLKAISEAITILDSHKVNANG